MKGFQLKQLGTGLLAAAGMFTLYFGLITLLSGNDYAFYQWRNYWPYVSVLAVGFGAQMFLYQILQARKCGGMGGAVAASGISGGAAMVACCAHHVVDLVPFLGLAGLATIVSSWQIQLFWVGIAFNAAGLVYLLQQVRALK